MTAYLRSFVIVLFSGILVHSQEIDIKLYQKIPMRDIINLSANIFFPGVKAESYPVIVVYTPYVNDEAVERGMFFAKAGYVFITLDRTRT
ncbi:MAG: hypothetical protein AAF717_03530 [Bacteroidota bacterium]